LKKQLDAEACDKFEQLKNELESMYDDAKKNLESKKRLHNDAEREQRKAEAVLEELKNRFENVS